MKGSQSERDKGTRCVYETEIVSNVKLEVAYLWKSVALAGGLIMTKIGCHATPDPRKTNQYA
jgi:hypothetical protein